MRHFLPLFCLAFVACTAPKIAEEPDAGPKGPPARVDLPPLIKLEGTLPPETHADGILRVDGLLARKAKHLDQKIVVRGYLVDRYQCPEDAKRCERPHVWLADAPGADKRMMLVGIDERIAEALKDGEQYVVTGRFARKSDDGFVMSGGLLIYEQVEGLELPPEDDKNKRRKR
ncbi:MAG: hypothetical protein KC549_09785 [Myxococcales bacterium]|nr:hypothetical protein [Myxococcales bacterium]MCB9544783.1 hypothetical protein [Myxococcales bacterium]